MSASDASILRLNDRDTIRFVQLYENELVLWNPQDPKYHKKDARDAAAQRVATELNIVNFTSKHVIMKFKNLRSSYLQEKKKIKESTKSGCSTDNVYVPKVIWFPIIDRFLKAHVKSRQTHSNLNETQIQDTQQTETQDGTQDYLETQNIEASDSQNSQASFTQNLQTQNSLAAGDEVASNSSQGNRTENEVQIPTTDASNSSIMSKKRKQSRISSEGPKRNRQAETIVAVSSTSHIDAALQKLDDISKRAQNTFNNQTHDDQLDTFGKYIASMLRSLPAAQSLTMQQKIVALLIEAQMSVQTSTFTPIIDDVLSDSVTHYSQSRPVSSSDVSIQLYSDNSMDLCSTVNAETDYSLTEL
ncbi:hypothetical protein ABEB36_015267 [Hypothenemus hampei]|uniref:MADF domain-containing protein n=1 Tax=Hypothenemus hampei TaxID=57062 RepID=A0ABD1DZQ1_HYPHA